MFKHENRRYRGADGLKDCPPEAYAAECRRIGREEREADANDEKLCDDLQTIYRREFRRDVARVLLHWCRQRGFSGGEFVYEVMRRLDNRGTALRLWFASLELQMQYLSVECYDDDYDDDDYDDDDYKHGDAATLERAYEENTPIANISTEDLYGRFTMNLESVCRAADGTRRGKPTLRDPVVLAAFVRTTTRNRFGCMAEPDVYFDWEAMPYGRQTRDLVRRLMDNDDRRVHRGCDCTYQHIQRFESFVP